MARSLKRCRIFLSGIRLFTTNTEGVNWMMNDEWWMMNDEFLLALRNSPPNLAYLTTQLSILHYPTSHTLPPNFTYFTTQLSIPHHPTSHTSLPDLTYLTTRLRIPHYPTSHTSLPDLTYLTTRLGILHYPKPWRTTTRFDMLYFFDWVYFVARMGVFYSYLN